MRSVAEHVTAHKKGQVWLFMAINRKLDYFHNQGDQIYLRIANIGVAVGLVCLERPFLHENGLFILGTKRNLCMKFPVFSQKFTRIVAIWA